MSRGENAQAGVDYRLMKGFKQAMVAMGKTTVDFPRRWNVEIAPGGLFRYIGPEKTHWFKSVLEGLGNKDWIAAWMEKYAGDGKHYRLGIPVDDMLMAINDVIAFGAMPVNYQDEIAAGSSEWFDDSGRRNEIAGGFYECCKENGTALTQGESPSYVYLLNTKLPEFVDEEQTARKDAPFHAASYSGCVQGIIAPESLYVDGSKLQAGDVMLGTSAPEWCSNGASIYIKRVWTLSDKFLTKLPNGKTFGEQALIPTKSCVALVRALQLANVQIHAMGPITGGGVAKITSVSEQDYTYRVTRWPFEMPLTCQFVEEQFGISKLDMLTSFNCGLQYVFCVPRSDVPKAQAAAEYIGFDLDEFGRVEYGHRKVIFDPEDYLVLPPPGD